jgi:pyridoxamine 5'-phosphate oxidase
MDLQEYVKFANENPGCFLATLDGDQPRVRPVRMWYADRTGFYFESKSVKALCQQLEKNPRVEICYLSPDTSRVMRVSGRAEFIHDMAVRERVYEERPNIRKQGVKGPEDPLLTVFAVRHGEAYFWTMAENMKESEIPRVRF